MGTEEINPAFVLQSVQKVSFENRAVPKLRDEWDVRIQIEQTGICGSDVTYWQRGHIGDFVLKSPIVLGHESSGVVVEVGSKVKNVTVGDRVAIEPGVPCRHCDYCRSGKYNLCPDTAFAATPPDDGTLQKYYIVAGDYCYPMPPHMSAEEGALVEPASVAVNICRVADLRGGQTVIVFGCGPIGVLCQAVAKAHGASRVIGVDISKSRAAFAKDFAADGVYVVNRDALSKGSAVAADPVDAARVLGESIVKQFGLGEGADVVLEATGAEQCIQAGIFACHPGGTYVQAGMGKENVVFPITQALCRTINIKGALRYAQGVYPEAVHLVASGKVKPGKLVTHRFKFDEALEAFELVNKHEENVLKVIIEGVH